MARLRRRPFLSGLLTFSIIAALETLSVLAMYTELRVGPMVDLLLAFAFHLGAATMLSYGFWGAWDFRHADEKNWAVVGFVMVLAVPIYGLIGFAFAFGAVHWRRRLAHAHGGGVIESFEKYIAYEPEHRSELNSTSLMFDGETPEDLERKGKVAPLVDVIKAGDPELKRGAIFSIAKLKPQTAVKILREALRDIDPESQFFIAGQLSRIEKQLSDQIIRTRRRLELSPDDIGLRVELARYGKDYVQSGLLDPSVEQYFLRHSISLCEAVLVVAPERMDVLLDLSDLLVRSRDLDGAVAGYAKIVDAEPQNTAAWVGLALCYYERRDLLRLGVVLEELKSRGELPASLHDVLAFWDVARPA